MPVLGKPDFGFSPSLAEQVVKETEQVPSKDPKSLRTSCKCSDASHIQSWVFCSMLAPVTYPRMRFERYDRHSGLFEAMDQRLAESRLACIIGLEAYNENSLRHERQSLSK